MPMSCERKVSFVMHILSDRLNVPEMTLHFGVVSGYD